MGTAASFQSKRFFTADEYFRQEELSTEKHEFRDGEIISMADGSNDHSLITVNVIASLWQSLKGGPCRVYESNLRVRVSRRRSYTYPDVSVICEKVEPDLDDPTGLTYMTPRLIVEVLSPSTESYDRTKKFEQYRDVPHFMEYVLVRQELPHIETFFRRDDGGWSVDFASEMTAGIHLRSIGVNLKLNDVYAGVVFPPPKPDPFEESSGTNDVKD